MTLAHFRYFLFNFYVFLYISDITIWYQFCLRGVGELPRTLATSEMELFVTLTKVTKNSILDVAEVLNTPLYKTMSVGERVFSTWC